MLREGEVRYSWTDQSLSTTPAYELTKFTFTGQYSYMDDPSTTSVTEGFGLMFYNARWYDPALGRFAQADTLIPGAGNPQAWDRYAYANNNPVRYNDPSGHYTCSDIYCHGGPSIRFRYGKGGPVSGGVRKDDNNTCLVCITRDENPNNLNENNVDKPGRSQIIKDALSIFNWGFAAKPFVIVATPYYYISPLGIRMTNTPSITWDNGSVLTATNTGLTTIGRGGFSDVRFTLNSDYSSNYGIFTSKQVNDSLKQGLGFSLPTWLDPQELTVRTSVKATVSMPSGDNMTITSTINTQIRYNPHGGIVAVFAVAPELAPPGIYVACKQLGWCP